MTLNYNEQEIDPTRMVRSRVILTSEEQLNYFVKNFARLPTIGADLYTTDLEVRFIEPDVADGFYCMVAWAVDPFHLLST